MSVYFFYEDELGGERIVTERIIKCFQRVPIIESRFSVLSGLKKTGSVFYYSWLISSVIITIQKILCARNTTNSRLVYTPIFTAAFAALLLQNFLKVSVCFHYHGNRIPEDVVDTQPFLKRLLQSLKHELALKIHRFVISNVNTCIAPSQHSADELLRQLSLQRKIHIIPNPVQVPKKNFTRRVLTTDKIILSVGRLDPVKKFELGIESIKLLQKKDRRFKYIIAYFAPSNLKQSEYLQFLKLEVEKANMSNYILFLENKNVQALYQISDAVLSCSEIETFSLVMFEAILNKKPFITTNTKLGSMLDSKHGVFFTPKNSSRSVAETIKFALNEEAIRPESHQQFVAKFKLFSVSKQILKLIANNYS